jgi:DNA-binding MarR family transcriptional regulator
VDAWLTDDEQRVWRSFLAVQVRLAAELNRALHASSGLSLADYDVLVRLSESPGCRLRPSELGQLLDWEQSRVSHQVTRMQRRGLVGREECPEDRRGAYVVLTRAGRGALERAAPDHVGTVRRLVFDGLTTDERDALERFSGRVLGRLGTGGSDGADQKAVPLPE